MSTNFELECTRVGENEVLVRNRGSAAVPADQRVSVFGLLESGRYRLMASRLREPLAPGAVLAGVAIGGLSDAVQFECVSAPRRSADVVGVLLFDDASQAAAELDGAFARGLPRDIAERDEDLVRLRGEFDIDEQRALLALNAQAARGVAYCIGHDRQRALLFRAEADAPEVVSAEANGWRVDRAKAWAAEIAEHAPRIGAANVPGRIEWVWGQNAHGHEGMRLEGQGSMVWYSHRENPHAGGGAAYQSCIDYLLVGQSNGPPMPLEQRIEAYVQIRSRRGA